MRPEILRKQAASLTHLDVYRVIVLPRGEVAESVVANATALNHGPVLVQVLRQRVDVATDERHHVDLDPARLGEWDCILLAVPGARVKFTVKISITLLSTPRTCTIGY